MDLASSLRDRVNCVVLTSSQDAEASPKPTVRLFIGTGPAHQRAVRVLIWSIQAHRDPGRRYEIFLLSELPGFSGAHPDTEFERYRYAVAHLAGRSGRALYHDVSQLYCCDPAEWFDADLDGAGFRSPWLDDHSVMLLDCARMAEVWPLELAQREPIANLRERARVSGDWAPLFGVDCAESGTRRPLRLLRYDTPHTQPWRPYPGRFVYQQDPEGRRWAEAEAEADAADFEVFSRSRPSALYRERLVEATVGAACHGSRADIAALMATRDRVDDFGPVGPELAAHDSAIREALRLGHGKSVAVHCLGTGAAWRAYLEGPPDNEPGLEDRWGAERVVVCDATQPNVSNAERADGVACASPLEDLPVEDLPWVLAELFESAGSFVHLGVSPDPRRDSWRDWRPRGLRRTCEWWLDQIERAARRRPFVHWQVVFRSRNGRVRIQRGGAHLGDTPPKVWVLTDERPGSTSQSTGLADALGWPYEVKQLRFSIFAALHNRLLRASLLGINRSHSAALAPPWPDLVIGAGRRAAPVAQWIRKQNFGRSRLVQLGRKGGDAASRFDLVVTPSYGRLDPHPRRIETSAPLHGVTEQRLGQGAEAWKTRLGEVARPRIVVLVGGRSGQYDLDDTTAERLGADVRRLAESTGGSILASTSRRTGAAESEAFCRALGTADYVHRWSNTNVDNPYHALLEAADAFVITGDSESMLGEAASSGRPIYIYPLPTRTSFRWLHVGRDWVFARAHRSARRRGGRTRGQRGLDYLCARLIDRGLVRPTRDLSRLHQDLYEAGVARHFGAPFDTKRCQPLSNREFVVDRVRALMRYGPTI